MEAEKNIFPATPPETIPIPDSDLVLRRLEVSDTEVLLEISTEEAIARYVPWAKDVTDMESSRKMIGRFDNQWQQGLYASYIIMRQDEACGHFGIWPDSEPGIYEVGYAILSKQRGKGIITKVLDAVEEAATTHLNAAGLTAYIDEFNEASRRAITKQGFRPTDKFIGESKRRYEKPLH